MALQLILGDITKLKVDAIVNAANSSLLGGGGVDGAIHRAAGHQLLEDCINLDGCETGEAKITKGHDLPASHIIHTVGPVWQGGQNNEASLLQACYRNSLNLALQNNLSSIAFPAISCGVYGYPIEKGGEIAIQTCQEFLKLHPKLEILLVLFSENELQIYQQILEKTPFSCDLKITDRIFGSLYGATVGDALGVPVEFIGRKQLKDKPVHGMVGYGTHNQPPGTWSDDTSLILCTISSLLDDEFDPLDIMPRFAQWYNSGYLAAHGKVFDIGNATREAISRFQAAYEFADWGCKNDWQNGNGALMRMLPVSLYTLSDSESLAVEKSFIASAMTHAHPRSKLACGYFTLLVRELMSEKNLLDAVNLVNKKIAPYIPKSELRHFENILNFRLFEKEENEISSSGYVIHTLEAALFCLHKTTSYKDAVLMAVNLGDDADTTGCVTGALAGIIYGKNQIPAIWLNHLAGLNKLEHFYNAFTDKICHRQRN